ncbi:putative ABC transport system permease protein [Plantibacter flavus]|uniref:Putative ABC transport system permease protein n=1 Tax=Plantibacter flavus TaxID=150123 RepID=A0A3N2BXL2_9MICO|nr:ABC transporter permease [Plantibacter flavus]ROR80025.1 putative ABC transport system permease protein [Plantibacter flavus]SMG28705.1 putative ABC transport system permease protein [Plantibacter flavus]
MRRENGRASKLLARDVLHLGTTGLRSRPTRAILSALGIAIGIAAMIAVVGISSSSQAQLNQQLDSLGTNLLRVTAGKSLAGEDAQLPTNAVAKVGQIAGVQHVGSTAALQKQAIYRSNLIEAGRTGGIGVHAASSGLFAVVGAELVAGSWFNHATASYPTVVLGAIAAERLGVSSSGMLVWLGEQQFTVIGILAPVALAEELDTSALIGEQIAESLFGFSGNPTTIYERSTDASVETVRQLLARTVSPQAPTEVQVSRPSDALAAKKAADQAFTGLLLGLGSVALLVGGIGVANTMVISVLERRREIGLRRALGATRGHIRSQFLTEALLLSALGGITGAALGSVVTVILATLSQWPVSLPPLALAGGVGATLAIGAIAGLYPAIRASHTPPTEALSS